MAETKFTPGPWYTEFVKESSSTADCDYHDIIGPDRPFMASTDFYNIADTMNRHHCVSPEEDASNARLIAAAPELYEALKAFMDLPHLDDDVCVDARPECKVCAAINIGRSALAKAVQP